MKMELQELFQALRYATMLLAGHTVTFVETPVDEEGYELGEEKTHMDLPTLIVRMVGETLIERHAKTKKEIEEALKTNGQVYESQEIPTGNPWHLLIRGSLN
jgi:hypothetical protein